MGLLCHKKHIWKLHQYFIGTLLMFALHICLKIEYPDSIICHMYTYSVFSLCTTWELQECYIAVRDAKIPWFTTSDSFGLQVVITILQKESNSQIVSVQCLCATLWERFRHKCLQMPVLKSLENFLLNWQMLTRYVIGLYHPRWTIVNLCLVCK